MSSTGDFILLNQSKIGELTAFNPHLRGGLGYFDEATRALLIAVAIYSSFCDNCRGRLPIVARACAGGDDNRNRPHSLRPLRPTHEPRKMV